MYQFSSFNLYLFANEKLFPFIGMHYFMFTSNGKYVFTYFTYVLTFVNRLFSRLERYVLNLDLIKLKIN